MLNELEKNIAELKDQEDLLVDSLGTWQASILAFGITAGLLLFIIFLSGFQFLSDLIYLTILFGLIAFVSYIRTCHLSRKIAKVENELNSKNKLCRKIKNLKILNEKSRGKIKYLSDLYLLLATKKDVYIDNYYLAKVELFLNLIDSVDYNLMKEETLKKSDDILAELHILTADYYQSIIEHKRKVDELQVALVHKSIGVEPFRIEQLQLTGEVPTKEILSLPSDLGDEDLSLYSYSTYGFLKDSLKDYGREIGKLEII